MVAPQPETIGKLKMVASLALCVTAMLPLSPIAKSVLMLLWVGVMFIPDGRSVTPMRRIDRAILAVAAAILIAVSLLDLSDKTERPLMLAFGGLLIIFLARLFWDFFKLTSEVVSTIGMARSAVRNVRARELALGRAPVVDAATFEGAEGSRRRGLRFRFARWLLTADMPWQRR